MAINQADRTEQEPKALLFARLARGDEQALEEIYLRYYARLRNYGLHLAGRGWEEEVHGVVQDFFIWLAQHYYRAAEIADLEAYMFGSVRRNILILIGDRRRDEEKQQRYLHQTGEVEADEQDSPEELFIREEMDAVQKSLIHHELHQLPPYQWETLYLRYYEGRSYRDIARLLAVSEQVARNYAFRALKRLKERLKHLDHLVLVLSSCANLLFQL